MADETDLIDGIARHLDGLGIVAYDPTGKAGNTFAEVMPAVPDVAVSLSLSGAGGEPDSRSGYDQPRMTVRVRGATDPRVSRDLCKAIRSELHGLGPITLPDGTRLILSVCLQGAPDLLGVDENRRYAHACDFRMEIRNPTTHRV